MKEKHLDINGKNIRIGDIVLLHKVDKFLCSREESTNKKRWDKLVKNTNERVIGTAGVVIYFGCVTVESCSYHDNEDTMMRPWADNEVEVIGNVR